MLSCSLPLFDILVTDVAEFLVRQMQPIFHPLDINMMQVNHENHDKMIIFIKNMMFKMTKTMTKDDEKKDNNITLRISKTMMIIKTIMARMSDDDD